MSEQYLHFLSLTQYLKSGALMFQHADLGERTDPPVPVPLVLLLQSLSRATGRRTSTRAGAGGATVLEDGDFDLDGHSQGLKFAMLKHNSVGMRSLNTVLKMWERSEAGGANVKDKRRSENNGRRESSRPGT